jgi:hypothetical protein
VLRKKCRTWWSVPGTSARAIKEFLALTGHDPTNENDFALGEDELVKITSGAHHVRNQNNGLQLWRSGNLPDPLGRLRLLVSTSRRREGDFDD